MPPTDSADFYQTVNSDKKSENIYYNIQLLISNGDG